MRSPLDRRHARWLLWERRHEDDGNAMTRIDQEALQLKSTETCHAHVADQAGGVAGEARPQELLGRRKRHRRIAMRPEEAPGCLANGLIIVDNRNHGDLAAEAFSPPETIAAFAELTDYTR